MKNTIFEYFKNLFYPKLYAAAKKPQTTPLNTNIDRNIGYLQGKFNGSADFTIRRLNINNIRGVILTMEGMCNKDTLTLSVINPLLEKEYPEIQGPELFNYIERNVLTASELTKIEDFEKTRYEVQVMSFQGEKQDEEKMKKLQEMYNVLNAEPKIKEYFDIEVRFNIMLADVNKIISESVKDLL